MSDDQRTYRVGFHGQRGADLNPNHTQPGQAGVAEVTMHVSGKWLITTCQICGRALSGQAYACQVCAGQATTWLIRAASLVKEVETTLSGQAVTGSGASSGSQGDLSSAAQLADTALMELETWARHLADSQGRRLVLGMVLHQGPVCAACQHPSCAQVIRGALWGLDPEQIRQRHQGRWMPAICRYLAASTHTIAGMPWAGEALPALEGAAGTLERVVDRPDPGVLVGLCACGMALYALTEASWVTCRRCGRSWDVVKSRDGLREHLAGQLLTAAEIAPLMVTLGHATTQERARKRINQWSSRGRILMAGVRKDQPVYRFGELEAMFATDR